MPKLVENDTFIDNGGVLQLNEEFVTGEIIETKTRYCGYGCSEQAIGEDGLGIGDCYIPGNHPHYPMHKKIVYKKEAP